MDSYPFLIVLIAMVVLVMANALYVVGEFATVHMSQSQIREQAANGNPFAKTLAGIMISNEHIQFYLSTCRVGMRVSSLALGFLGQVTLARWLAPHLAAGWIPEAVANGIAIVIILLVLVVIQVVPGEIIPRSLARKYAEAMALVVVWPIAITMTLFRPVIFILHRISEQFLRVLGKEPVLHQVPILSPEEIELLASESARSGLLEPNEQQLLHNVFRAGELTAVKVMVPRTRLVAAPETTPLPDLLQLATTSGHTRIPLYRETIDTIIGIVHLKDLFRLQVEAGAFAAHTTTLSSPPPTASVLREVSYVPLESKALAVWKQLQQEKSYVAIVLDEFGGTAGMITVADLIEEIFGELRDEFDDGTEDLITQRYGGCHWLGGEVLIADVNERFKLRLPDEQVNTIGGLVMTTLGRLPQVGDEVFFDQIRLQVETINGPRVLEVSLHLPPDDVTEESIGEK